MKKFALLAAVCVLTATSTFATELSKSDRKWCAAVEEMITAGPATIATPNENRAKLAKQLADKHGRESKIEKTDKGYKIIVQAPDKGQTAKK